MTPGRAILCATMAGTPRVAQLDAALRGLGYDVAVASDPDGPAALVVWAEPASRLSALPVDGRTLHVIDLGGLPSPHSELIGLCRGAGLLLVRSDAAHGAWSAALTRAGIAVPMAVVPYAVTAARQPAGFGTLTIVQGVAPDAATLDLALRATAWAAAHGVGVRVAGGGGPAGLLTQHAASAVAGSAGAVLLDVRTAPGETDGWVEALARGTPVLGCAETPLLARLIDAGAGRFLPALEPGLDEAAALPRDQWAAMADAAAAFAQQWFDPAQAGRSLSGAITRATARMAQRRSLWRHDAIPDQVARHVLVISDEALNLVDTRVRLPMDSLHRRGAIGGYSVLRHGEIAFTTDRQAAAFDAIWVHRSVDAGIQLLLRTLARPFAYDVDDNLLASPSYRDAFPAETIETALALLRGCTALSCATPALAALLQRRGRVRLADKAVVTPNLAAGLPAPRPPGPPRAVVWASSDTPALTASRVEVERAIRDVCLAHGLTLVCLGAPPPRLLAESAVAVEHVGLLPYPEYLDRLRGLSPAILVCPLETGADPQTQDFVDGKSDVKAIDAALAGLVGVYSRARPYLDSGLGPHILCDNDYESWVAGLEAAIEACRAGSPAPAWPDHLDAARLGPLPWAEAVARVRLERPVSRREMTDGVAFVQSQQAALLADPRDFDEEYYLGRHDDVRIATEQGVVASGYEHYRTDGHHEGRAARRRPGAKQVADVWWVRMLQGLDRLEDGTDRRGPAIERLRTRLALRRALPPDRAEATPEPKAAPQAAPHPTMALVWHPGTSSPQDCPVCDAAGPHPALLRADGDTLLRCGACGSCFYEHRVVYDYEEERDAAVLQQFNLEQNASIHHQSRFLFMVDDPGIDSFLDVGCGFGFSVDVAAKVLGWRAVGIDPSFYAREGRALLHADIRTGYLTADTELGEPFGLVLSSEVIEHVPDPHGFLALLRRWLTPGGSLVLTTPDADSLSPSLGAGSIIGVLAVKVHLILFTAASLELALRRAGFRHVQVRQERDGLVAYASDKPLRFQAETAALTGYLAYLRHLVESAEPGSAVWNGGAGRLFAMLAAAGPLDELHALFARIAEAWRAKFGIDMLRRRLPELLPDASIGGADGITPDRLGAAQPFNLPGVLFNRAVLEYRTPGRTPEQVLAFARPAYTLAVQSRRVLQAENLVDLDLKLTAWRARQLIVDCLTELAPELEGELLHALAQASPGDLHDRIDLPAEALVQRITPFFTRMVQADRFDEARRVEPWVRDVDALCAAHAAQPERLLRGLFTLGVLRLVGDGAPSLALPAFLRMEAEAAMRLDDPATASLAQHFLQVAREHVQLARSRLGDAA